MSDEGRAIHRAVGAFDNFRAEMARKLEMEGRSPEYIEAFWENLRNVAFDFAHTEGN